MATSRRPNSPARTYAAAQRETAEAVQRDFVRRVREDNQKLREAEKKWRAWRALEEFEKEAQVIARIMAPRIIKRWVPFR